MDRVLRAYAHTAWTPTDPLAGLDNDMRRAILLMPSTFRERWKLAPWTDRHQRRMAIADIVAERRLLYELTHQKLTMPAPEKIPAPAAPEYAASTSAYYQYRLAQHHQVMDTLRSDRAVQDIGDIEKLPEARADYQRRETRRQALLMLNIERSKLDIKEFELLAGRDPSMEPASAKSKPTPTRSKGRRKEQAR